MNEDGSWQDIRDSLRETGEVVRDISGLENQEIVKHSEEVA